MPRNVAPSGLPTCLNLRLGSAFEANISNIESSEVSTCSFGCNEVLRRNSCVTATPMLAKASDVRSQARKVRSAPSQHGLSQIMTMRKSNTAKSLLTQSKMIASYAALVFQLQAAILVYHPPPPLFVVFPLLSRIITTSALITRAPIASLGFKAGGSSPPRAVFLSCTFVAGSSYIVCTLSISCTSRPIYTSRRSRENCRCFIRTTFIFIVRLPGCGVGTRVGSPARHCV